ncbi:Holliday junction branch migration protein RuvA [Sinomicrobium weinanense]|uniref:Holliday junction branch migration complex subunit RuvA n=1 Tax=Sinomicrobium weinanense TaxID=2842200 RepID=A0A926JSD6_9FLAO|nr:Holliday junction branch migration protein RuvA [Sinomicrobium weinanense]MBC9796637.1 Holliday junction branch migration protein RuvA [Sinomicrobium weinanense]MBU3123839.1 Holliday junction branch migration protein RuvA [Sinomicrobium weinanense]
MITHIQGRLVEKNPTDVVIDCNGVGYYLNISLHTYSRIPDTEQLKLYTHLHIREDGHTLFGFADKAERDVFRLLISVSGIGTSTARTMLSSLTPVQVRDAIAANDVAAIQSVKGIGAKTAQRVILDLKDKVLKIYGMEETSVGQGGTGREEALSALEVLGFARKQSEKVVDKIVKGSQDLSVEDIIKNALKML